MEEQDKKETTEKRGAGKADWNIKPYLAIGLLVFIVFCCCISVFFLIYRYNGFASGWKKLMNVLQPIIIGLVVAYLLNPIMMFFERNLKKLLAKKIKSEKRVRKLSRGIGTAGALLVLVLIVYTLLMLIIPQLTQSIMGMITNLPEEVQAFVNWMDDSFKGNSETVSYVGEALTKATSYLENWLKTEVLPQATTYIASITNGVISVVKLLFNMIIGLIVSVYVMMEKEKFIGQAKKVIYAVFKPRRGNIIVTTIRKSNKIFGGFITGKILDSAIIGVICYICLAIMQMPYTVLVSVIVGVTNIIPFFGPYIGAIPSFIIIALANPIKGLYFLIFIIILQQVDGNIIGPKILGDSTGLSSFWVVFAILVGGGVFGVPGMILGVPTFAVIYYIMKELVEHLLRKRNLPDDTKSYIMMTDVDVATNELRYQETEQEVHFKKKKEYTEDESGNKNS